MIPVYFPGIGVKVFVDISRFLPPNLSDNGAYEESIRQGRRIDRRTLSGARKGVLTKCDVKTLVHLRDFASSYSGQPLTLEDILRFEPDEEDELA